MNWTLKKVEPSIIGIVILVSVVVMLGWAFEIEVILSLIPGSSTMKFNTALLFLLGAIELALIKQKSRFTSIIFFSLTCFSFVLASLTLVEDLFKISLEIDNLFIDDPFSAELPGRMSPGTSVSFMLLSISLFAGKFENKAAKIINRILAKAIILVSFTSVVSFLLIIPMDAKSFFLQTMAIHTSFLFLSISSLVLIKNPDSFLVRMVNQSLMGSILFKNLLPVILGLPIILGLVLSIVLSRDRIEPPFAIAIYATATVVLSIIYVLYIASRLNATDIVKRELDKDLKARNNHLFQFKKALEKTAMIAITDTEGIVTYVNAKLCRVSKYRRREWIGNSFKMVYSGHHGNHFFKNMWSTISSGQIWSGEIKNLAKDNSEYWVNAAIIPLIDKEGQVDQYIAIMEDITERKNSERIMERKYLREQQRNLELEQFAYIASHDLQEPLKTISSFSEYIKEEYKEKLDDKAKKSFDFINDATGRMSELIKGLLDYSRIGKERELTLVDCNELVEEVIKDVNKFLKNSSAIIDIHNLPTLSAYKLELRLLFQNLLINAAKFSREGINPEITIFSKETRKYWRFSVQDNGIGIAKEHLSKIFVIFQRLHARSNYEGTGIGLAHCQKIVEMHGGEIWVESVLNEGSTFHFTIPKKIEI